MTQRNIFLALTAFALALFTGLYFRPGPKAEDVEINVKQEKLAPGSLRFEGTILNTSARDISEVTVSAAITNLSFTDDALNGCGLESRIAKVKNLKAGETRAVIWYFTHDENQLRCGRRVYPDRETVTYTVFWDEYRWTVWVSEVK